MVMIPSPIARPTSNDSTLFCADAMSRAYVSSVRYHSCTVAPPSAIANASLFVSARNSSSSSKSADDHGAATRVVEGDDAGDDGTVDGDPVPPLRHPVSSRADRRGTAGRLDERSP